MNIPIAHNTESLRRFLQHIENVPVPEQVTSDYLKEAGFLSSHDRELLHIFRILGFVDAEGRPLQRWAQYKEHGDEVLQIAIHESYLSLFELYPDKPFNRSDEALRLWFRPPVTGDSKSSVIRAIRTFRKLCLLAGMIPPDQKKDMPVNSSQNEQFAINMSPHVTTRLPLVFQLPVLTDREQYIELFEAIQKVFYE